MTSIVDPQIHVQLKTWLLELLPTDGSAIGNISLFAALERQASSFGVECTDVHYKIVRDGLIDQRIIGTGRGRGGSVYLIDGIVATPEAAEEPADEEENAGLWDEQTIRKVPIPPNLERLRNRLLDLSGRNRLLNFSHSRSKRFVRVVDEQPDQLFKMLTDEKSMRFDAVPEPTKAQLLEAGYLRKDDSGALVEVKRYPTAEDWARWLGIKADFELPAKDGFKSGAHEDSSIQTLYFAPELESRLKTLFTESHSAIEETGANVLYLALGFLEWTETVAGKTSTRLAPLVLLPVRIERGELNPRTSTYEYKLSYNGEEIFTNLSLREKLKAEFGIALPSIRAGSQPEVYFNEVTATVLKAKPEWSIRRFGSLGLFEFSKLMMYLDLDPNRWADDSLIEHMLVKQLTGSGIVESAEESSSGNGFAVEYQIDTLPDAETLYPLMDDADSSQHSAVIDVLNGMDLVIEGPPGTGKSQTITNIVAAAIAQGKTVLFVAEKNAALEVVSGRLARGGLGDFCLEMHSHKSQKRAIIDKISKRLSARGSWRSPAQLEARISLLKQHKDKLNRYVELLHTPFKDTGLSIYEVLNRARRLREVLPTAVENFHPSTAHRSLQEEVGEEAAFFGNYFISTAAFDGGTSSIAAHPWFGLQAERFDGQGRMALLAALTEALVAAKDLQVAASELAAVSPHDTLCEWPINTLSTLAKQLQALRLARGDEDWTLLPRLDAAGCDALVEWLNCMDRLLADRESLSTQLDPVLLSQRPRLAHTVQSVACIRQHSSDGALRLLELRDCLKQIVIVLERAPAVQLLLSKTASLLPAERAQSVSSSMEGLRNFARLTRLAADLPRKCYSSRDPLFENAELDVMLPELEVQLQNLKKQRQDLAKCFSLEKLPPVEGIEDLARVLADSSLFRWFKGPWRHARKSLLQLCRPGVKFGEAVLALDAAEQMQRGYQKLIVEGNIYKVALGRFFQGLETDLATISETRRWYRDLRKHCGRGFGATAWIADWLVNAPVEALDFLREESDNAETLEQEVDAVSTRTATLLPFDQHELRSRDLLARDGLFAGLNKELGTALDTLSLGLRLENPTVNDCAAVCKAGESWYEDLDALEQALALKAYGEGIDLSVLLQPAGRATLSSWRHSAEFLAPLMTLPDFEKWRARLTLTGPAEVNSGIQSWIDYGAKLAAAEARWLQAWQDFAGMGEVDAELWWQSEPVLSPTALLARLPRAAERSDLLDHWLEYRRLRGRLQRLGFGAVIHATERGDLDPVHCKSACLAGLLDLWAKDVLETYPELAQFSGKEQNAYRARFAELDHELKSLQRARFAWQIDQRRVPPGLNSGRVKERTELALLEHEASKQRRHEPIRSLMHRAGDALQALMPCFMMSPMAVAQYLPAGKVKFDLVIMDEASQVRAEEALGSFARAKQVVVVGDPKQLPPTNFFSRQGGDDDTVEEDTSIAQVAESILDAAIPLFRLRRLRWHYRSRHESLIAFSNTAFYDGNLVVYPSPYRDSVEYGIKFVKVSNGRFVDQRNIEEAEVVVRAVEHHVLHSPDESLGVVAMNIKQTEQIERMLEERSKDNPLLREALDKNKAKAEPLFIKNLENVQGDERDVIFISCTYGPTEAGGHVAQRFGPINGSGGWRRLNVLFTRSKKRMHIFASFAAHDVHTNATSSRGVHALKGFLEFAETGRRNVSKESGHAPDSDFEIAVMEMLASHGYECEPQVGVAGFFIDLAVRDPNRPGRYLMGIECDGASYHSSKSARDRDRLRQSILEQLGWKIQRIWSVDWFRNARAQLEPILAELARMKSAVVEEAVETEGVEEYAIQDVARDAAEHFESLVSAAEGSLRDRLEAFDRLVIRPQCPNTNRDERLLRPAMIEALLEFQPATKWEFVQNIPGYLRTGTSSDEGRFLDDVLTIISGAETNASLANPAH